MRQALAYAVALGLLAVSLKTPPANAAPSEVSAPTTASGAAAAVSGAYTAAGQSATITDVSAHSDEPFDGKPVTALVFTARPQNGDANALNDAHNGDFGDAIIVRVQAGGVVIGADLLHHGLTKSNGYVSAVGLLTLKDYAETGAALSGRLTSDGPHDAGDGESVNVDLTFRAKAP